MGSSEPFHAGEVAVQKRAGGHVPGRIRNTIPPVAAEFLTTHQICTIAGLGPDDRMYTTMLCGPPGSLVADDEHTLHVRLRPPTSDPLYALATFGGHVGTIIMDSHRRMRVNGHLEPVADGFVVHTEQVFSNCGRYISDRHGTLVDRAPGAATTGSTLTGDQADLIRGASTMLIGTCHPAGPADASHRGGNPGWIHVDAADRLSWPDYDGNHLYMTLGNITADHRVGLLFLDWTEGTTLQVSGRADIDWSRDATTGRPGALRIIRMTVEAVQQTVRGVPMTWSRAVLSRFNPGPAPVGATPWA